MKENSRKSLTLKQQRAVNAYIRCWNKSEAYRHAYDCEGMDPRTVGRKAQELFSKPHIVAQLAALRKMLSADRAHLAYRVKEEIASIAFANILDFMTWDSSGTYFFPSKQLSRYKTAALRSIRVRTARPKAGRPPTYEVQFEWKNSVKALGLLMKILGINKAKDDSIPTEYIYRMCLPPPDWQLCENCRPAKPRWQHNHDSNWGCTTSEVGAATTVKSGRKLKSFTPKQQKAVDAYLQHGNKTKAYRAAYRCSGSEPHIVRRKAHELFAKPHIVAYIEAMRGVSLEQSLSDLNRLIRELTTVAFANVADFVAWDEDSAVVVASRHTLRLKAPALKRLRARTRKDKDGNIVASSINVKMADSLAALALLVKILGMDNPPPQAPKVTFKYVDKDTKKRVCAKCRVHFD